MLACLCAYAEGLGGFALLRKAKREDFYWEGFAVCLYSFVVQVEPTRALFTGPD